ncbi:hypothetical protein QTN25_006630 [Entamoeba marina]
MPTRGAVIKISLLVLLCISIVVLLVISFIPNSPIQPVFYWILTGIEEANFFISAAIVILLFNICLVFMLPVTPLTMFCGYIYGLFVGSTVGFIGCLTGALTGYFIGKFIGKDYVDSYVNNHPRVALVQKIVEQKGIFFYFPIEIVTMTYFGTAVSTISDIFQKRETDIFSTIMLIGSIILSIAILVVISVYTKKLMSKYMGEENNSEVATTTAEDITISNVNADVEIEMGNIHDKVIINDTIDLPTHITEPLYSDHTIINLAGSTEKPTDL